MLVRVGEDLKGLEGDDLLSKDVKERKKGLQTSSGDLKRIKGIRRGFKKDWKGIKGLKWNERNGC